MSRAQRIGGIVVGGVLAVAVVTAATLWEGNVALDPDLDAASVWVANADAGLVGVVNTQTDQLESIVDAAGAASEVLQSDDALLVVDRSSSVVRTLDAATQEQGPAVLVPAGSDVQLAGSTVAVVAPSNGDVWLSDVDRLADGDALGEPVVQLGRGAVVALTATRLFAASPGLGRVLEIDVASGETVSTSDAPMSPAGPSLQLTAVGTRWVLLDETSGVLSSGGWQSRVDADEMALQQPGPASGRVLVATETGIEAHELGVQTVQVEVSDMSGTPARPLVTEGCLFGAWSDAQVWRHCGDDRAALSIEGIADGAGLEFAERGGAVVLSDAASGDAWTVTRAGALVDDWSLPTPPAEDPGGDDPEDDGAGAEQEEQLPPEAVDDELGARPGVVTILPVLENDTDPNGDALTVVAVSGADEASIAPDGRGIRLSLPDDAAGTVSLSYTVSDGVGGEATAVATVSVRSPDEDEPPVLQQATTVQLAPGATAVADALAHWIDPEGDPLVLLDASSEAGDPVRFRPDGRVEIADGGAGTVRDLAIVVSDGRSESRATIEIAPVEAAPLVAGTVSATTWLGQTATVAPLLSVQGSGSIELHNVEADASLDVVPSYVDDTIAVTPSAEGVSTFAYVVTDGTTTATGQVRIHTLPAVDPSTPPQPRPHAVGVLAGGAVEVEVADLDVDPSGGVLVVTGATSDGDVVRADVVDQDRVRIELAGPLDSTATVRYTITNGVAEATGTIEVVERDRALQAPIARDDDVRVAPGGAIDIPVLANDEHPDGADLELVDGLVEEAATGLAFVDGDRLRYVAAEETGSVDVAYEVRGPDGQSTSATVHIDVADADAATNVPPVPPTVDARVVAGEVVDIPIDLSTADPNGDAVTLLGQSSPAALGTATQIDGATLRYAAGQYSVGTEELEYVVADELGERAVGTIRIGVAAPESAMSPPIAEPDLAEMQPGATLSVDVLANDLDPAGLALDVVGAVAQGDVEARIQDGEVLVTAPDEPGEHGVVVTIESSRGSQAVGWLRVVVDPAAAPPVPQAQDVRVPITSILDREVVSVSPLDAATVADGAVDALEVALPLDVDGTRLDDSGVLEIAVRAETRIVPYTVTRTDTGQSASALVLVPGTDDALPQLRVDAPPIVVLSGETIEIDIDDHVVAVDGGPVMLTDGSTVLPSHGDGGQPVVDSDTLRFTSAPGWFGPASIAFEVTDGDSPRDPDGRVAPIVLPITVEPSANVPGRVLGTTVQLEPDQERVIDLARITSAADPSSLARFRWSTGDAPAGFETSLDGSLLTVRSGPDAPIGTEGALEVGVSDPDGEGVGGTLRLVVITSTRPLAQPQPDRIAVVPGGSASIDLLANDQATNPFPGVPLVLGSVDASTATPLGVSVGAEAGSSVVTVSTNATAPVGTLTVRYQVLDATGEPRRAAWGLLTIVVHDVPDRPAPPVQAGDTHVDGGLVVRLTPPGDGNSPITGYVLVGPNGYRHDCGRALTCTLTDLPPGVDVRLQLIATNEIGSSAPSEPSEPMHADRLPAPVAGIAATPTTTPGSSTIRWDAAAQPAGGTAVTGYIVRISGPGIDQTQRIPAPTTETRVDGLQPGQAYAVDVAATNAAGVDDGAWRYSTPFAFSGVGPPGQTQIVTSGYRQTSSGVNATATWSAASSEGGAPVRYTATTTPVGQTPPACTTAANGTPQGQTSTSWPIAIPRGGAVVVQVAVDNGWFCSVSQLTVSGPPATLDGDDVRIVLDAGSAAAGTARDTLDLLVANEAVADDMRLELRVAAGSTQGSWATATAGQHLATVTYGEAHTVYARQCATAGTQLCSDEVRVAQLTPLRLAAEIATPPLTCRWNQQLQVRPPSNPITAARSEVVVTFVVDGQARTDTFGAGVPIIVPAGASRVTYVGQVAFGGGQPVPDPQPDPSIPCQI